MKKKIELYTPEGWLNVPAIDSLGCWLNVIIGARQVGKTYGTLKLMLDTGRRFAYWRRSEDELDFISANPDVNPFRAFRPIGHNIEIVKAGKHDYRIGECEYLENGKPLMKHELGAATALLQVAKLRGFDGSAFTDIIYDEFIPERIVAQRKAEGDACVNGYITYNGNRELEGKPPIKLWLLANANRIESPVLAAWDLLPYVERLMRSNKEYLITDSGIFIAMPMSEKIIGKRKETRAMAHLGRSGGSAYNMAINNQFGYDSLSLVRPQSLRGMKPMLRVGELYVYDHGSSLYISKVPHNRRPVYGSTPEETRKFIQDNKELFILYARGLIYFDSAKTLIEFRQMFGYKN